jgi:excisionase family DNA binding protein
MGVEKCLTKSEAAERVGKTGRTITNWIVSGRLPAHKIGSRWMIWPGALDRAAAGHEAASIRAEFYPEEVGV